MFIYNIEEKKEFNKQISSYCVMAASILRLRAAAAASGCRQFASSAVCLMLLSNKMYSLGEKKVVNINSKEEYSELDFVVGSSHGWVGLLKDEEERVRRGSSSSLSVWNPMSGSRMKLPPIDTIPQPPNCRLSVEKLMVNDAECSRAIMMGSSSNWLGVCCPDQCSEWTRFGHDYTQYEDVVAYSQSRVYSLNRINEMVRWDISDPRKPRIEWENNLFDIGYNDDVEKKNNFPRKPDHLYSYRVPHLVYAEHSGQLFVVTRHFVEGMDPHGCEVEDLWNSDIYPMKTVAFDVHLVETARRKGRGKVRYMEHSLDGLVMFVGLNDSFAVSAAHFPHLNPDSIYFTDHAYHIPPKWDVDSIYGGHDIGIYDYKNRTISSCYYPTHHHSFKRIRPHPFWFTPT